MVPSGLDTDLLCCEACMCGSAHICEKERCCFCLLHFFLYIAAAAAERVKYAQSGYISGQSVGKLVKSARRL